MRLWVSGQNVRGSRSVTPVTPVAPVGPFGKKLHDTKQPLQAVMVLSPVRKAKGCDRKVIECKTCAK